MNKQFTAALAREIAPTVQRFVTDAVRPVMDRLEALEARQGPAGITGAIKDHAGCLIITLTDGKTLNLGDVSGRPGKDGRDGRDGKDADAGAIAAEIPAGKDGKDADPKAVADILKGEVLSDLQARLEDAIAALSIPKDWKGADPDEIRRLVLAEVEVAIAKLLVPKDGRDGTDGVPGKNGEPGRDGRDGLPGVPGGPGKDGLNGKDGINGIDGRDGLGFDDVAVEQAGDRGFVIRFIRGDQVKEFPIALSAFVDRGVWRDGAYLKGDGVSWGGSFFIAQTDTTDKPETSAAWRLAVKRGRDGKEGKAGEPGRVGPPGKDGRDLTQMGFDGSKH